MSSYRDDTQETAVASSETWLGLSTVTEEICRVAATAIFGLGVVHADVARASDEVVDVAHHVVTESATVGEEWSGRLHGLSVTGESAVVSESWRPAFLVVHEETARAADEVVDRYGWVVSDSASVSDEVFGHRTVSTLVHDTARASGYAPFVASDSPSDTAIASDMMFDMLAASDTVSETLSGSDEVVGRHTSWSVESDEIAWVSDGYSDHLAASDIVEDVSLAGDSIPVGSQSDGQAWTANTETWAMSRYFPYGFRRIAVINGALYGEGEDGLYALSGGTEIVSGEIVTGDIDIGGGSLARPIGAYFEFSMDGTMEMEVSTAQSGARESYTYTMPSEQAEGLTNGRIRFGRGLRGRHFRFALRVSGSRAHVNDMRLDVTQTRRRV